MRFGSNFLYAVTALAFLPLMLSFESALAGIPPSPLTGLRLSYHSPRAMACYAKQTYAPEVKGVLDRNNMSVNGSSSMALEQAMATVAQQFEKLGRADLIKGIVVKNFPGGKPGKKSGTECTNYTRGPDLIEMVTDCGAPGKKRNTTAQSISSNLLHEFMHSVGQQGYYNSYFDAVPACHITGYCYHNNNPTSKRREEFAEVGSLFVHTPQLLQQKCPKAYEFFAKNIFKADPSASLCDGVAAINSPEEWKALSDPGDTSAPAFDGGGDGMGAIQALTPAIQAIIQHSNNNKKEECTEDTPECKGGTWIIKKGETKPQPAGNAIR